MNNTTKPEIQVLDSPEEPTDTLFHLLLFSHYLIAFPAFLLCWFVIIRFLKRRGHLSASEADTMIHEMKNFPRQSLTFFGPK